MNSCEGTGAQKLHIVVVCRALGRKVLGQLPLAAGRQHVENTIDERASGYTTLWRTGSNRPSEIQHDIRIGQSASRQLCIPHCHCVRNEDHSQGQGRRRKVLQVLLAGRLDVARLDTELEPPKPTTPRAHQYPSIQVALRCWSVSHMAGQPHQRSIPSRPSRRPTWGRQSVHPAASASVSGSQRAPSAVRNLPLESIDHSSSGAVCALDGSADPATPWIHSRGR